jgi:hypothetical protein
MSNLDALVRDSRVHKKVVELLSKSIKDKHAQLGAEYNTFRECSILSSQKDDRQIISDGSKALVYVDHPLSREHDAYAPYTAYRVADLLPEPDSKLKALTSVVGTEVTAVLYNVSRQQHHVYKNYGLYSASSLLSMFKAIKKTVTSSVRLVDPKELGGPLTIGVSNTSVNVKYLAQPTSWKEEPGAAEWVSDDYFPWVSLPGIIHVLTVIHRFNTSKLFAAPDGMITLKILNIVIAAESRKALAFLGPQVYGIVVY